MDRRGRWALELPFTLEQFERRSILPGGWIDLNLTYDQNILSIKEPNIPIFTGVKYVVYTGECHCASNGCTPESRIRGCIE